MAGVSFRVLVPISIKYQYQYYTKNSYSLQGFTILCYPCNYAQSTTKQAMLCYAAILSRRSLCVLWLLFFTVPAKLTDFSRILLKSDFSYNSPPPSIAMLNMKGRKYNNAALSFCSHAHAPRKTKKTAACIRPILKIVICFSLMESIVI